MKMNMFCAHILKLIIAIVLVATVPTCAMAQQTGRTKTQALAGESIDKLLTRCNIETSNHDLFIAINWPRLTDDDMLMLGFNYYLPTKADIANAKTLIEREKKARAEKIAAKKAAAAQTTKTTAATTTSTDKKTTATSATTTTADKKTTPSTDKAAKPVAQQATPEKKKTSFTEPLFGKGNEEVKYVDSKLAGATYYLVSGHGGPDPGAMSTYDGQSICEDEYAYDVILRLGRQLISHRATVHFIIQDPNDGIREDAALKCDEDETCMGATIPLDQVERLKQRSDSINALYAKERKGYCRSVFIHVDSRSKDKRIDIFFYHFRKSERGQRLALTLQKKMAEKYAKHQPNRSFSGEVKERDLYVLRETNPAGVFIEIGNIQNDMDMVRLAKPNNREAMARWMAEALIEDFRQK